MKYVIILVLLADPIYLPFDNTLTCHEQGEEIMEVLAVYKEGTDTHTQGWYLLLGLKSHDWGGS